MVTIQKPAKCKSCGAPVLWLTHRGTGKAMPIDVEPSEDGNVILFGHPTGNTGTVTFTAFKVLSGEPLAQYRENHTQLRTSHMATCPQAADFRKPKGAEPVQQELMG